MTAADSFKPEDMSENLLNVMLESVHDPKDGYDRIFSVGTVKLDRERSKEVSYWRDLNQLACQNPVSCDRTTMYDTKNAGRRRHGNKKLANGFRNGATFMEGLLGKFLQINTDNISSYLDPSGYTLNPYYCYLNRFSENCRIKPITRVRHSADLAYIDDETGATVNEQHPLEHQEPHIGILPNSCCGHKPYNSEVRCCDESTQKFVDYDHCFPEE